MTGGHGSNQYRTFGSSSEQVRRRTGQTCRSVTEPEPWTRYPTAGDVFRQLDRTPVEAGDMIVDQGTEVAEASATITGDTIEVFRRGGCHVMAAVLHDRTGWPVVALGEHPCPNGCDPVDCYDYDYDTDRGEWCDCRLRHFLVRSPDGMLWDVAGENDPEAVCDADDNLSIRDVPDDVFAVTLQAWNPPPGLTRWAEQIVARSLNNDLDV